MTWTKLDDSFHSHPKVRKAWRDRTALGLHVLAINYSTCHSLNGEVPVEFVEDQVPDQSERARAIQTLLSCGLWERSGDQWRIHDYLDFQPSRERLREARRKDAERKRKERE